MRTHSAKTSLFSVFVLLGTMGCASGSSSSGSATLSPTSENLSDLEQVLLNTHCKDNSAIVIVDNRSWFDINVHLYIVGSYRINSNAWNVAGHNGLQSICVSGDKTDFGAITAQIDPIGQSPYFIYDNQAIMLNPGDVAILTVGTTLSTTTFWVSSIYHVEYTRVH